MRTPSSRCHQLSLTASIILSASSNSQAQFAQWLLDHPKYLQSVSLILSLVSIFEYNSKKNPAFGPEFRALAESASALTLKLLDLCEDKEAHYLITVRHLPPLAPHW